MPRVISLWARRNDPRSPDIDSFERLVGPIEPIQTEWHAYVRRLKAALAGNDLEFLQINSPTESKVRP